VDLGAARCAAAVRYAGAVRDGVRRFKFKGKRVYAEAFGKLMADALGQLAPRRFDAVLWVPCSRKRRRRRGYDQSKLLAEQLSRRLGVPLWDNLRKPADNPTQNKLRSDSERAENVRGVFAVEHPEDLRGKRLLLADDILTSGATLRETANLLCRAGAAEVFCVVLAKAR
jgi:ComF family protein